LDEKKAQVRTTIDEQGNMTAELAAAIENAATLAELEDIYRPYKPKRRTRATMAMEKGLLALADLIWAQDAGVSIPKAALQYIDAEKGVNSADEAIAGASDILAERISDDPACREAVRRWTQNKGFIVSAKKALKEDKDENRAAVYDTYSEYRNHVKSIPSHSVLAINRGEKEGFLCVAIDVPEESILAELSRIFVKRSSPLMADIIADSYKRLTAPAIEREIRNVLTDAAEQRSIKVFGDNLRQLLLQPPLKDRVVLAIDPGFRTGCKVAAVDEVGRVLATGVVYATTGKDTSASKATLLKLVKAHNVSVIAIGNGTAGRETEAVVAELIRENKLELGYVIVNESGASVYSASKLAADELPDYDVALRSAVSIGRRLQDPLAELVKIDPKSIGVGQYQHDMNQKHLAEALGGVVEGCVNAVGVDLNTASPSLLSYVAGISTAVASNIIAYREEHGKFRTRNELKKVAKLGPKAFEQCAGFLRVPGSKEPLDNTGVHPESYAVARAYISLADKTDAEKAADTLGVGLPTLRDIISELEKPGRDPRDELPPVLLRSDVLEMKDLTEGMKLTGTVRNVADFGAFVDIGVHCDGLVHSSQMANSYVRNPQSIVKVGDIITVKVLSVDMQRKRISLSMKD
jgi:uncharacterized protein